MENSFLDLPEPQDQPWCISFSNTVGERNGPGRIDRFKFPQDLRDWLAKTGILDSEAAQTAEDPRNLERAIRLREAIYSIASSLAKRQEPDENDLSELNWNVQRAIVAARLEHDNHQNALRWNVDAQRGTTAGCLGLIALSAAGLFASSRAPRIRICDNNTCGWLFLDLSKNHSRKWCDMSDCGNLAKARRYYAKQKALRTSSEPKVQTS